MEIKRNDSGYPVLYMLKEIRGKDSFWSFWFMRESFKEEGLVALAEADDKGNWELNGKRGVIEEVSYSLPIRDSAQTFTFEEFNSMGRPLKITREKYSVYKPIDKE